MTWKAEVLTGLLVAFSVGIAASACPGQSAESQDKQGKAEKFNLAWKFASGDVIRVQHRIVKDFDSESGKRRHEHSYQYFWIVEEFPGQGTTKIRLAFEDIAFVGDDPRAEFHTASDDATEFGRSANQDFRSDQEMMEYQARSMANADVTFEVLPSGGTMDIHGSESLSEVQSFTPGDLPGLPSHPVAVGDTWNLPLRAGPLKGESKCKLVGVDRIDGCRIAQIECVANWRMEDASFAKFANVRFEPSISVSRFDIDAGRFIDEKLKSKFHVLGSRSFTSVEDQERDRIAATAILIEQSRRMELVDRGPDRQQKSGTYVLAYHEGRFKGIVMAGAEVRKATDPRITVEQLFQVDFFHSWQDQDRDFLPNPEELRDVSTRFTIDEDVKFLVSLIGMQDRRLHFEILDAYGSELTQDVIPIRPGPAALAVRKMRLPAGIYFFEFFVDSRFLLRVPVQVFRVVSD